MNGVPRVDIAPGYSVPRIINGAWQHSVGHAAEPIDREDALAAFDALLARGFTAFDCADIYTGVEEMLGEFLAHHRRGGSEFPIRIHTKFVPDLEALPGINRGYVTRIIDRSLARLGVDALDLVQFHWWDFGIPGYVETAYWLDELRKAGKVRNLGVTNFDVDRLSQLVEAGIFVLTNQVQYSALDRRPSVALASYCQEEGISLLCYGGLAGGFLTEGWLGREPAREELANRSLEKYRLIIEEMGGWEVYQGILAALKSIARRHEVSIPAVALRFVLDQPGVAATITGLDSVKQARETRQALALELGGEDWTELDRALATSRIPPGPVYGLERDREGPHGRIMKYNLNRE